MPPSSHSPSKGTPSGAAPMRERRTVLNIGVGGATSSGKTTMAKHLVDLLTPGVRAMQECMMPAVAPAFDTRGPAVALVHQDDFLNQELPWNDDFGAEDWDTPYGSVDYRKTADALAYVAQYGDLPLWYKTHDHLNELRPLPVTPAFRFKWQARFQELLTHAAKQSLSQGDVGQPLCIVVTEGFLLYFDPEVRGYMDIKLFIRTPRAEVLFRRENRGGYITETGSHWVDPPGYFDKVVWPAYQLAHQRIFDNGDVEHGKVIRGSVSAGETSEGGPIPDLILIEDMSQSKLQDTNEVEQQLENIFIAPSDDAIVTIAIVMRVHG